MSKGKKKINYLASREIVPQSSQSVLQKMLPFPGSWKWWKIHKGLKGAHLQEEGNSGKFLSDPVGEEMVLQRSGSLPGCPWREQAGGGRDSHPQGAPQGLCNVLQSKSCLPRKGSSLAARQEAKQLKQKNTEPLPLPRHWKKDPSNYKRPLSRRSGLAFFQMGTLKETEVSNGLP